MFNIRNSLEQNNAQIPVEETNLVQEAFDYEGLDAAELDFLEDLGELDLIENASHTDGEEYKENYEDQAPADGEENQRDLQDIEEDEDRRDLQAAENGEFLEYSGYITAENAINYLYTSINNGEINKVQFILDKHPEAINFVSSDGNCLLHYAVFNGYLDITKLILEKSPELLTLRNLANNCPLKTAFHFNKFAILAHISKSFRNYQDLLHKHLLIAAHNFIIKGELELLKDLLSNFPQFLHAINPMDYTLLTFAIINDKAEIAKYIITNYPEATNVCNKNGHKPFEVATNNNKFLILADISRTFPVYRNEIQTYTIRAAREAILKNELALLNDLLINFRELAVILFPDSLTLLSFALINDKAEIAKYIIANYPEATNVYNQYANRPLFVAALYKKFAMLADISFRFPKFRDEIQKHVIQVAREAILKNELETLKEILINFKDLAVTLFPDDLTLLSLALINDKADIAKYIITNYPEATKISNKYNHTPLFGAAFFKKFAMLADICRSFPAYRNEIQKHVIQVAREAILKNELETLKEILINFKDLAVTLFPDDLTLLSLALINDKADIAKYIITNYPEATKISNKYNHTPLFGAAFFKKFAMLADIYRSFPAYRNEIQKHVIQVAREAILKNELETLKEILNRFNKIIDFVFPDDHNLLSFAMHLNKSELAKYILQKNPKAIKFTNQLGETVLHLAAKFDDPEMLKILLKEKIDVNKLDNSGNNALQIFIEREGRGFSNILTIAELFIEQGINLDNKNNAQKTALDLLQDKISQGKIGATTEENLNKLVALLQIDNQPSNQEIQNTAPDSNEVTLEDNIGQKRTLIDIECSPPSSSSTSSKILRIEAPFINHFYQNEFRQNSPIGIKVLYHILPFKFIVESTAPETAGLLENGKKNSFEFETYDIAAQQGFRFLPTISYFLGIYGITFPNIEMSSEVRASIDYTLGKDLIKSGIYYSSLKTTEMISMKEVESNPTDLQSLMNVCVPELTNGIVAGASLMDPASAFYGLISGAAQCLSKHQLIKQETELESWARFALDNGVLAISYFMESNPLSIISNVVMTDISFKVFSNCLDIWFNGIDNTQIEEF